MEVDPILAESIIVVSFVISVLSAIVIIFYAAKIKKAKKALLGAILGVALSTGLLLGGFVFVSILRLIIEYPLELALNILFWLAPVCIPVGTLVAYKG